MVRVVSQFWGQGFWFSLVYHGSFFWILPTLQKYHTLAIHNPQFKVFKISVILKDMSCSRARTERMRQCGIRHVIVTVLG